MNMLVVKRKAQGGGGGVWPQGYREMITIKHTYLVCGSGGGEGLTSARRLSH